MSNVITHPRFDRPKVHQPHPRMKRGTISFRAHHLSIKKRLGGQTLEQVRERGERLVQRWDDLREAELVPLYLPNSGKEAYAVFRALKEAGLSSHLDTKRSAIVLYAYEPGPAAS